MVVQKKLVPLHSQSGNALKRVLVAQRFTSPNPLANLEIESMKRAFSSAGLEHLPYKQRVGGSNPSAPTGVFPLYSAFVDAGDFSRAFSSAGLEHLPYKQRVGGSNPSTPTSLSLTLLSREPCEWFRDFSLWDSLCTNAKSPRQKQCLELFAFLFLLCLVGLFLYFWLDG